MLKPLTEKLFYQYLKCPHWIYFDAHSDLPRPHDSLMTQLIDDGLLDAKQREIISDRVDVAEVLAEDMDTAFNQTLEFMQQGRQTIYHGVLIDGHWVGHPDILERVEGRSNFGNHYYIAADIKHSRFVRDEFQFQGCFYADLLEKIQGVRPVNGYIITPDRETLTYAIEEFEEKYHLSLVEIEKILAGKKPAHFVTSGCKQSPWFDVCKKESDVCDDLSLLNRVWREEISRLQIAGVNTISKLSKCSIEDLEKLVPDVGVARLETMRDQAISMKKGTHIIREKIDIPSNDIELYFDIESDPLRDFDYLFGILKVTKQGEEYIPFMAAAPDQEAKMWLEFCDFIAAHFDAPIFHYGSFEVEVLKRFSARYGVSPIVEDAFEQNMIDILEIMRHAILFPLPFYSLKDIAAYSGFHWRASDASGANSVLWFEDWLKSKRPAILQKILEYNEDDVRATLHVVEWARKHACV